MCARRLETEYRDTRSLLIAPDRSDDPHVQRITAAGEINSLNAADLQQVVLDGRRRLRGLPAEVDRSSSPRV
jgi:hypothetical protein